MTIERNDPRLKAAELSEDEFVGKLVGGESTSDPHGLLEVVKESHRWDRIPEHPLIEPLDGYSLHYDVNHVSDLEAYLCFQNQLVGFLLNDTVFIAPEHRSKGLSRELILGAFAQNRKAFLRKERAVTSDGARAIRSAHRFVTETARRLDKPLS